MIISIDPGYTTGVAIVSPGGELISSRLFEKKDALDILYLIRTKQPSVIIIEDFVGSGPRTKEAIFVLKLIGSVIGVSYLEPVAVILQVPQFRKPLVSEAEALAPAGTSKHIIAAYAHALAWLEKEAVK